MTTSASCRRASSGRRVTTPTPNLPLPLPPTLNRRASSVRRVRVCRRRRSSLGSRRGHTPQRAAHQAAAAHPPDVPRRRRRRRRRQRGGPSTRSRVVRVRGRQQTRMPPCSAPNAEAAAWRAVAARPRSRPPARRCTPIPNSNPNPNPNPKPNPELTLPPAARSGRGRTTVGGATRRSLLGRARRPCPSHPREKAEGW
jgi:hypothetical protein